MVVASLTIGALVGIVLSGGFVYWEVGRFAEPQVPVTRFDERREIFAYTAGLFVGVPLAVAYTLFGLELRIGSLFGAIALLAALVGGTEAAQILLIQSRYWTGEARPFYALGFRAAVGGIVALAIVASYLGGPSIDAVGVGLALATAAAVVALEVAGALLSLPPDPARGRPRGGPWAGAAIGGAGFFMIGIGTIAGEPIALAASIVVLIGASFLYLRLRPWLETVRPPSAPPEPGPAGTPIPYGRTEALAPGNSEAGSGR